MLVHLLFIKIRRCLHYATVCQSPATQDSQPIMVSSVISFSSYQFWFIGEFPQKTQFITDNNVPKSKFNTSCKIQHQVFEHEWHFPLWKRRPAMSQTPFTSLKLNLIITNYLIVSSHHPVAILGTSNENWIFVEKAHLPKESYHPFCSNEQIIYVRHPTTTSDDNSEDNDDSHRTHRCMYYPTQEFSTCCSFIRFVRWASPQIPTKTLSQELLRFAVRHRHSHAPHSYPKIQMKDPLPELKIQTPTTKQEYVMVVFVNQTHPNTQQSTFPNYSANFFR